MNDLTGLARESLRRAVERSAGDLSGALEAFGWRELAETDEPLAFSALFEELGRLGLCTDALDLTIVALSDLGAPASVVWPRTRGSDETDHARSPLIVDGIALRSLRESGQTILTPLGDRLFVLEADLVDEEPLGGMAEGYGWVRVHAGGACGADVGSWPEMDRRARLSVASELVAVTQRIMEVATEQVSTRRQFRAAHWCEPVGPVSPGGGFRRGGRCTCVNCPQRGRTARVTRPSWPRQPPASRTTQSPNMRSRCVVRSGSRMSTRYRPSSAEASASTRSSGVPPSRASASVGATRFRSEVIETGEGALLSSCGVPRPQGPGR